jgi:hypothetical protein
MDGAPTRVPDATQHDSDLEHDVRADAAPDESEGNDTDDVRNPVCDDYRSVWIGYRIAKREECSSCLLGTNGNCPPTTVDPCSGAWGCMTRNCACEPGEDRGDCAQKPVPDDMCACLESCLPDGPSVCRQVWLDNMACVVRECRDVCGTVP